jgi:hypothetical protein
LDGQYRKGDPAYAVDIDRRHDDLPNSPTQKSPGRSTDRRLSSNLVPIDDMGNSRQAGQRERS